MTSTPAIRPGSVRIKPDVVRKLGLGPITRPQLAARIETTAKLMAGR